MAVIKKGEHIQDIRGSVKSHVYSDWRGRGYLRSKAINPSNPRSSSQADTRESMSRFSRIWKSTFTDDQRALWNEYAQKMSGQKPKLRGAVLIISYKGFSASGFNTFVMVNRLLYSAGLLAAGLYSDTPPTCTELAASPTGLAGVWNYGEIIHYSEDFEDEALNSTPNQWTPPWTYTPGVGDDIKVVAVPVHGGVRAGAQISGGVLLSYASIQQISLATNNVELTFYTRVSQDNLIWGILHTSTGHSVLGTTLAISLAYFADKTIRYHDGIGWQIAQSYVKDVWYKVKCIIHDAARKYDLEIDDVPIASGITYRNNVSGTYLLLVTPFTSLGASFIDDILLRLPVTPGVNLSWTDPVMHANSRVRIWTYSEEAGVHKQQVATVALGEEAATVTNIRAAKGASFPIGSLPGHYWFQLDVVDPVGVRSGSSNAILVDVPAS